MKKTMLRFAVAAALAVPFAAPAALHDFTFTLDQAQEIEAVGVGGDKRGAIPGFPTAGDPPLVSPGFGAGFARYDDVTNKFVFVSVTGTGLIGSITDQHIHTSAAGGRGFSGGVALNMPAPFFNSGGTFAIFGTDLGGLPGPDDRTTFNETEEARLLLGNAYFNIHTSADPAGEIRGQLIPVQAIPEPETYALMLAGLGLVGWVASRRRKADV